MPGILIAIAGAAVIGYALFSPYRVVVGFRSGRPFALTVRTVGRQQNGDRAWLEQSAASSFEAMREVARSEGVELHIASAFRSWEEQVALYTKWILRLSKYTTAKPGWSNHQQGTTVDLDVGGDNWRSNPVYRWLINNGSRFGFCRTVHCEAHHWEYLGIACTGYTDVTPC